jgi:hypothetical protein
LDHYPFSKGTTHWLQKHNAYSSLEAQQIGANRASNRPFSVIEAFLGRDRSQRRFHQKEIFYRMPARPLLKFLLLYVGKRGFLDGRAGLSYATLQSFYEYMIVLKTQELTARVATRPPVSAGPTEFQRSPPEKSRCGSSRERLTGHMEVRGEIPIRRVVK